MLQLQDAQLIGRGTERYCYRHPQDPTRCVKVTHNFKNDKQQNKKDYEYFTKLERRGIDWSHLPHCHGWTETDQGEGLVFDLLQDEDGKPLERLDSLLASGRLDAPRVASALEDLYAYLQANLVFTSDLRASNIVCDPQHSPLKLFLIDGIGDRDFIKLAVHLKPLARAKIDRQWARFKHRLKKQNGL